MTWTAVLWVAVAVAATAWAVRGRRSPLDHPLPTAFATGAVLGLSNALIGLAWRWQLAGFVATSVGLAVLLWRWRTLAAENNLDVGVGGNRLVGRIGTVVTPVDPDGPSGTVRLGAETWRATAAADAPLPAGRLVTVVAVEGIHVVVEPADN